MKEIMDDYGQFGKLLWEEPQEKVRKKTNMVVFIGLAFFAIAFTLIPIGSIYYSDLILPYSGFLVILGSIIIIIGYSYLPVRIYDDGILFSNKLFGYRHFISWGEIINITEMKPFIFTYFIFETKNGGKLRIEKDLPGLPAIIEEIRDDIGMDDSPPEIYGEENERVHKKLEMWLYPFGVLAGLFLSMIIIITNFEPSFPRAFWAMVLGFGVPLISIIIVSLVLYEIENWRIKFSINLKVNMKTFTAFLIIINLVYFTVGGAEYVVISNDYNPLGEYRQNSPPNDFWEGGISLSNGTYNINENLYIPDGIEFMITDAQVIFGSEGKLGIFVDDGGHLIVRNSTISSDNQKDGVWFEVYGKLTVINSVIQDVFGDPDNENMDGGIEIYSGEAYFEESTIQISKTNGIMAKDSILTIVSSTIENCQDDGIELHGTSAIIEDSLIRYNGWPIMFWEKSDARVSNSTFHANKEGLYIIESSPTIEDCIFTDTVSGPAINVLGPNSEPVFEDNAFSNNEVDVEYPIEPFLVCCFITLPILSLIFFVIIYTKNKNIGELSR